MSGCHHYASALDIVAIKFKCCNRYYACYYCHRALEDHSVERWRESEFNTKAILCGKCGIEMSIQEYLSCNSECLRCKAPFNPKCSRHWNWYFMIGEYVERGN